MTPERLEQIQELYHAALERDASGRAALLAQADSELRREVESLLAQNGGVMEKPAMEVAADLLASGELKPGAELGPYRVEGLLGAGGMGRVYKARDTRLGRAVAIKVASSRFSERFQREARAISALNHPHLCTLYDVGPNYLVMELVEGPTLADRIKKGPVPLEQALAIARQIAEGLVVAHDEGIVHRDLKPANIKIKPDGTVKILDFGLAKTARAKACATGESTVTLTETGTIMGTAAYMSPEQARGEEVDKRADIWAFGVVLYEMLTARKPFQGNSTTEIMASVIREEPDLDRLPAKVRRPLRRCLEKDSKKRLRDIGDVWQLVDEAPEVTAPSRSRLRYLGWIAAIVVLLAAIALLYLRKPPSRPTVARFQFSLPDGQDFTRGGRHVVAISPDGTKLVYAANHELYLRAMDQLEAQPIRGTNEDPVEPVFSPDGQWLAYFVPSPGNTGAWALKKIAIAGGAPVTLGQLPTAPFGADWRGAAIAFGMNTANFAGIQAVPDSGGALQTLVAVDRGKEWAMQPRLLDDGKHVLFSSPASSSGQDQIVVQTLNGKQRKILVDGGADPRVLSGGWLAYIHQGTLTAVPFDVGKLAVAGDPIALVEGVQEGDATWAGQFAVSGDGTLVFVPAAAPAPALRLLVWVDRQGREQPIPAKPQNYRYPRLSPDGVRIVVDSRDKEDDIWVLDLGKGTLTRVTFGPAFDYHPIWMPDGKYLLFDSSPDVNYSSPDAFLGTAHGDIFLQAADGTGTVQALTQNTQGGYPLSVSPDGKSLIFRRRNPALFLLPLDPQGQPRPLIADSRVAHFEADISPDGRWIAYQSPESGRTEIYVRPFPAVDSGRWQISDEGGTRPVWARSGHELFFLNSDFKMVAVPVQTGSNPTFGKAQPLFDASSYSRPGNSRSFDVSPDGKRFLMLKDVPQEKPSAPARPSIIVVSHWLDEVKARIPAK